MSNRRAACVSLACILAIACACSSRAGSNGDAADATPRPQGASHAVTTDAHANGSSFMLANFTGNTIRVVNVSPSDSKGWEENVLGADELKDGDTVVIHFSPEERAALWDMRVESGDEHYAEWKGIDLRGVSRITLLLNVAETASVVAEVE